MKLAFLTALFYAGAALAGAQDTGSLLYRPEYTELKQYLSLTDSQIQALQAVQDNRNAALQVVYDQINQKNDRLYKMLAAGTGTAAELGQLLIDINNLQKQLPLNDGPYRTQALTILTADQKAKLPKLVEAQQLQYTASMAVYLLLIEGPSYYYPLAATSVPGAPAGAAAPGGASAAGAMFSPMAAPMRISVAPAAER